MTRPMSEAEPGVDQYPVLYSFRRCPYAIRARLALAASGSAVMLREVLLRDKPTAMLEVSPKGTVPVLVLPGGRVLDESVDIMRWALRRRDPQVWWVDDAAADLALIETNDTTFKTQLDQYKYFTRYPPHSQAHYRAEAEATLRQWEQRIADNRGGLMGAKQRLADAAVFPFVRQFAGVDPQWWASAPYPALRDWLQGWMDSAVFAAVMRRVPRWQPGSVPVVVDWHSAAH